MNHLESERPMISPAVKIQSRVRALVLGSWFLLLSLVWWRQLAQGVSLNNFGWALLYCVPLLAPLPGLLKGKRYTHAWATLCVLPYFIVGVTEAVANGSIRYWAMSLLGASLLWFFALISYLRVTLKGEVVSG